MRTAGLWDIVRIDVAVDVAVRIAGDTVLLVPVVGVEILIVEDRGVHDVLLGVIHFIGDRRTARGAEGRDLDDLATEEDMRQTETSADQPAVAEEALDLLRQRVGRDIEILGLQADHQVADTTADQKGRESRLAQAIEDP